MQMLLLIEQFSGGSKSQGGHCGAGYCQVLSELGNEMMQCCGQLSMLANTDLFFFFFFKLFKCQKKKKKKKPTQTCHAYCEVLFMHVEEMMSYCCELQVISW